MYVFGAQHSIYKTEEKDTPRAGSKPKTITFSEVAHFTITFSEVLIIVQDYTTSTLRLISNNILHTTNLLRLYVRSMYVEIS